MGSPASSMSAAPSCAISQSNASFHVVTPGSSLGGLDNTIMVYLPAACKAASLRERVSPFVVSPTDSMPGSERMPAVRSTRSRRSVGSPPVSRTFRTPALAKSSACMHARMDLSLGSRKQLLCTGLARYSAHTKDNPLYDEAVGIEATGNRE